MMISSSGSRRKMLVFVFPINVSILRRLTPMLTPLIHASLYYRHHTMPFCAPASFLPPQSAFSYQFIPPIHPIPYNPLSLSQSKPHTTTARTPLFYVRFLLSLLLQVDKNSMVYDPFVGTGQSAPTTHALFIQNTHQLASMGACTHNTQADTLTQA